MLYPARTSITKQIFNNIITKILFKYFTIINYSAHSYKYLVNKQFCTKISTFRYPPFIQRKVLHCLIML